MNPEQVTKCEVVMCAFRKTKDGTVVSFTVHPNDMPELLSNAHVGTRFMLGIVELADNE